MKVDPAYAKDGSMYIRCVTPDQQIENDRIRKILQDKRDEKRKKAIEAAKDLSPIQLLTEGVIAHCSCCVLLR